MLPFSLQLQQMLKLLWLSNIPTGIDEPIDQAIFLMQVSCLVEENIIQRARIERLKRVNIHIMAHGKRNIEKLIPIAQTPESVE
jgi:hypothetical protein